VFEDDGRFLHDFSYAGYHRGETTFQVDPDAPRFHVDDYGADPSGTDDSTAAIQSTIDAAQAASGGVVEFGEGLYRVDDRLEVSASGIVMLGAGSAQSRVYFTRADDMSYASHITFRGTEEIDLELELTASVPSRATQIEVADAGNLQPGDHIDIGWEITPEFVEEHQMTGTWQVFNDTWQTFFRREVVDVDRSSSPHRIQLDVPIRYPIDVRDRPTLRRRTGYLRECAVIGLGLANATDRESAWAHNQVHVLELRAVRDCVIDDVASFAPPTGEDDAHLQSGGIIVRASKRVTISDSSMAHAQNLGSGGNGYLFETRTSSEVLTRDCDARAGRHNFTVNWGFGTTGCVWLRVHTSEGREVPRPDATFSLPGDADFHHSLATANLIDSSRVDDGWEAINRKDSSSGAGHTATETVFWNVTGSGRVTSYQFGNGYLIGTAPSLEARVIIPEPPDEELREQWDSLGPWEGTRPEDWGEGIGRGEFLQPPSLYEDQLRRRLQPGL
jgi:hypothetical protein